MANTIKYNEPLFIVWRKGTADDPFVPKTDTLKIINGRVVLSEIPDSYQHVVINGYSEIYKGTPVASEFIVDYATGIVTFNHSEENKTIVASYFGKGIIQYPAERIFVHRENPDVVQNLQEIIDNGNDAMIALDSLDAKISEASTAISNANSATISATNATADAINATTNANSATADAINAASVATSAATDASNAATAANTAATNANDAAILASDATTYANDAGAYANSAGDTTNYAIMNANDAATSARSAANELVHKGAYASGTVYKNRNVVDYNGSSYMCIIDNTVGIVPTDATKWKLVGNGINFRNAWSNTVAYSKYDVVSYAGSTYMCIASSPAGSLPTDVSKWAVLAVSASMSNAQLANDPTVDMEASTKRYTDNIVGIKSSEALRQISPSGILDFGPIIQSWTSNSVSTAANPGVLQVPPQSNFSLALNSMILNRSKAIINGNIMDVASGSMSGATPPGTGMINGILLNAPPTTGQREDLVFLEAWFDPTDGSSRNKMRWRIRVVDGVDFSTSPEGLGKNSALVTAQGANATPIADNPSDASTTRFYSSTDRLNATSGSGLDILKDDVGLYVCGRGQSTDKTRLGTVDGYVYAIPLFRVRRRSTAPYNADTNPHGGRQYYSLTLTLGQTINPGVTFQVTIDAATYALVEVGDQIGASGSTASTTRVESKDGNNKITLKHIGSAAIGPNYNPVLLWAVGNRPDQKYSNVVYIEDIIDLRHQVSLSGFPYQNLLANSLDKLLKAQLHTSLKPIHRRDFVGLPQLVSDDNTVLLCRFDGSMNGVSGSAQTPVAATQINAAPVYKNGVSGQAAYFDGTTAREYRYQITGLTPSQGSIEWVASKESHPTSSSYMFTLSDSASPNSRILMVGIGPTGNTSVVLFNDAGAAVTLSLTEHAPLSDIWSIGSLKTFRLDWDSTGMYLYADGQLIRSILTRLDSAITTRGLNYLTLGCGSDGAVLTYRWNGRIDELRVSNVRRPTGVFQVPAGFDWANGDRIIDGPDGVRSMWSDDQTTPCGLTDVPQQFTNNSYAECQYPTGTPVRHYYQGGLTPGWSNTAGGTGSSGTGITALKVISGESSGEQTATSIPPNEQADGTRTTFTFTRPSEASDEWLLNSFMNQVLLVNSVYTSNITELVFDAYGNATVTLASPPPANATVAFVYLCGSKHIHFAPNTKGFVFHDWKKYSFTGNGVKTQFDISNPTEDITRTVDFNGKIAGQISDVPHIARGYTSATFPAPSTVNSGEFSTATYRYIAVNDASSTNYNGATSINGYYGQHLFSFDLLNAMKNASAIPSTWNVSKLKSAIKRISVTWVGYGIGSNGGISTNGAQVKYWNATTSAWVSHLSSTASSPSVLSNTFSNTSYVDANGVINILGHSTYPGDGTIASAIYTDYVKVDITLSTNKTINVVNHVRVTASGATEATIQNTTGVYSVGADGNGDANHRVTFTTAPANGATIEVFVEEVVVPAVADAGFWVKYSHVPYQGVAVGSEKLDVLAETSVYVISDGTGANKASSFNSTSGLSTMLPISSGISDSALRGDTLEFAGMTSGWNVSQMEVRTGPIINTFTAHGRPSSVSMSSTTLRERRGVYSFVNMSVETFNLTSSVPHLNAYPILVRVGSEIMLAVMTRYRSAADTTVAPNVGSSSADLFRIEGRPLIK